MFRLDVAIYWSDTAKYKIILSRPQRKNISHGRFNQGPCSMVLDQSCGGDVFVTFYKQSVFFLPFRECVIVQVSCWPTCDYFCYMFVLRIICTLHLLVVVICFTERSHKLHASCYAAYKVVWLNVQMGYRYSSHWHVTTCVLLLSFPKVSYFRKICLLV